MFSVYIIKSIKDDSYYVGHTNNLEDRLKRHNEGRNKYTKSRKPWKLVYTEEYETKSEAMKRESEIKRMRSKVYIENLISNDPVK